jgi:hypothetical protein
MEIASGAFRIHAPRTEAGYRLAESNRRLGSIFTESCAARAVAAVVLPCSVCSFRAFAPVNLLRAPPSGNIWEKRDIHP